MHYIILDLEWNQPVSLQMAAYRKVGDRLTFEMIQIGAVRMDENRNMLDTLSVPIAPTCYLRIHPRIRRMTGLGPEELAGAPAFREALEQFSAWCGEDCVLLTWGCDDISVLHQNVTFFECGDIPIAPIYDVQMLFAQAHGLKERPSLKKAMEMVGLVPDENMAFHNARNDAWYTAQVFRTLPDPAAVLEHRLQPKELIHRKPDPKPGGKRAGTPFPSLGEALQSDAVQKPVCPRCGRNLTLDGEYVPISPGRYITVGKCRDHRNMILRAEVREDCGEFLLRTSVTPATHSHVAYVHTKQFQAKLAREEALQAAALQEEAGETSRYALPI